MDNLKNKYAALKVSVFEEDQDLFTGLISDLPFTGTEQIDDVMILYFLTSDLTEEVKFEVEASLSKLPRGGNILSREAIDDRNWNEEWEKNLPIVKVDEKLTIAPKERASEVEAEELIVITPKMSFGTGEHATTRLSCRLMRLAVETNSRWIDVGAGTGVLAIFAAKLGAKSVLAFDNNEWSVENAAENIDLNDCSDKVEMRDADLDEIELPVADGIAANLFKNLLIPAFPKFYDSLKPSGGVLIVSGVLKFDESEVKSAAADAGFEFVESLVEDEWIACKFKA